LDFGGCFWIARGEWPLYGSNLCWPIDRKWLESAAFSRRTPLADIQRAEPRATGKGRLTTDPLPSSTTVRYRGIKK
jgi:hypothetical protein